MSINNGQNHEQNAALSSYDSMENKSSLQRHASFDDMSSVSEARVLVIYTGGTIGMTRNSNNGTY